MDNKYLFRLTWLLAAVIVVFAAVFIFFNFIYKVPEIVPPNGNGGQIGVEDYDNKNFGVSFAYSAQDTNMGADGYQSVTNNPLIRIDLTRKEFVNTNLIEASFVLGVSRVKPVLDVCLEATQGERGTTTTEIVNGREMKVFRGLEPAAGNLYETNSYRAVVNNTCYEATLLLHSGNINNYEDGAVHEFDRDWTLGELKKIVDTLKISDKVPNIVVFQPVAGDSVRLPLTIRGQARVFENTFAYRIKDGDGSLLLERHAMSDSPDSGYFGDFSLSVNYPKPVSGSGTVEVFEYSAKDGAEINKTSVPVSFQSVESMNLKVFYPNRIKDSNMLDCAKVYEAVRRTPKTQAVARTAIEELLKGPDRVEAEAGYFSNLNSGVVIQSLTIQNGVAKIDFNEMLEVGVAGSCNVLSIRSQIENTLKQFPTVSSVVISINGRVDDILQP